MNGSRLRLILAAGVCLMAAPAAACVWCGVAIGYFVFPPVIPMGVIGPLWYVALSFIFLPVVREWRPVRHPAVGLTALVILGAASYIGFGPWTLAPFAVAAAGVAVRARLRREFIRPAWTLRASNIVSGVAVIALLISCAHVTLTRLGHDRADIVIMFPGAAFTDGLIKSMGERPDAHAGELRSIVSEAEGYAGGKAAKYLAKAREPAAHVPLILDQLAREEEQARGDETGWGRFCASYYREALAQATGLKLPEHTTSGVWRARLAELDAAGATTPTQARAD